MAKMDMSEAKIVLELSGGFIRMGRGEMQLVKRKAYEGDWNKIVLAVLNQMNQESRNWFESWK